VLRLSRVSILYPPQWSGLRRAAPRLPSPPVSLGRGSPVPPWPSIPTGGSPGGGPRRGKGEGPHVALSKGVFFHGPPPSEICRFGGAACLKRVGRRHERRATTFACLYPPQWSGLCRAVLRLRQPPVHPFASLPPLQALLLFLHFPPVCSPESLPFTPRWESPCTRSCY
jgi:hypothetical protein